MGYALCISASGSAGLAADRHLAAVSIAWSPVGDPGNAADTTTFGSVGYDYSIGTYEVTNAHYAEFLNAKAASDSLGLYNTNMGGGLGGITRSGVSGSFTTAQSPDVRTGR